MICLCCGKEITNISSNCNWHKSCIKKFFNSSTLPELEVSNSFLMELAKDSINKGLTVPGVQKKLSLKLTNDGFPRLTLVNYPTGYILKPQTSDYTALPEAEYLIMQMAKNTGINTVPFALIESNNQYAYITKRIDRNNSNGVINLLAMEDFCQLDGKLTIDKYKGSYENCAKIIKKYSSTDGYDMTEMFLRVVFSYVVGNSDMHLKNFSLIETYAGSGIYKLSDAYDMLPVNVILPSDDEHMALTLNGKKRNLRKNDFLKFAFNCGINETQAKRMINKVVSMKEEYLSMCEKSFLPSDMKSALIALINDRIEMII